MSNLAETIYDALKWTTINKYINGTGTERSPRQKQVASVAASTRPV